MVSWVESRKVYHIEEQHSCGCPRQESVPTPVDLREFTHMEVTISMVIPSADRVDESRVIELTEKLCQVFFWRTISLAPSFIVNDLLKLGYDLALKRFHILPKS